MCNIRTKKYTISPLNTFQTITPIDNSVVVERRYSTDSQIAFALDAACRAFESWRRTSTSDRAAVCSRFVDHFVAKTDEIAAEITTQMGRPISQAPAEVRGFEQRARHMIAIAEDSLRDIAPDVKQGYKRFIKREPLGVVLTLAPWNYPYLTAVNSIVPAIMAGNTVLLKHSEQTPLCADRFAESFEAAGLPTGVFQTIFADHETTADLVRCPEIDFVAFTGSVEGGRAIQGAASSRFIGVGLELGGKDPAYVRPDAPLEYTIENLADGVFYNAGQSCCAIERIYAHEDIFDRLVSGLVEQARLLSLGNPLDPSTTLGPMVRTKAADLVRAHIDEAEAHGARSLLDLSDYPDSREGTPYHHPQILIDVDHSMRVMHDETFGPVVGIMKVRSDDEAVGLMNDSRFGLTASVWTEDEDAALELGARVETGTWFMNRCDYLDPALAWTGVKDSGRGCTLSQVGYEHLTRPKSFHLRRIAH